MLGAKFPDSVLRATPLGSRKERGNKNSHFLSHRHTAQDPNRPHGFRPHEEINEAEGGSTVRCSSTEPADPHNLVTTHTPHVLDASKAQQSAARLGQVPLEQTKNQTEPGQAAKRVKTEPHPKGHRPMPIAITRQDNCIAAWPTELILRSFEPPPASSNGYGGEKMHDARLLRIGVGRTTHKIPISITYSQPESNEGPRTMKSRPSKSQMPLASAACCVSSI